MVPGQGIKMRYFILQREIYLEFTCYITETNPEMSVPQDSLF